MPASPVVHADIQTDAFQDLIDDMLQTMVQAHGVGLAAPQIGRSIRLAVIDGYANHRDQPYVLINPTLSRMSSQQNDLEEGCLSIPKVFGEVPRASRLQLDALDRDGQSYTIQAEDFFARVIQHEVDHLNGRLYIDRMHHLTKGTLPS